MSSSRRRHDRRTPSTWVSCWRKCSKLTSKATDKLHREVLLFLSFSLLHDTVLRLYSIVNMAHFHIAAPDVAALALSGDWAAEFLSGPESASAPGAASLADAADAEWTREFIAEAAGSRCSTQFSFLLRNGAQDDSKRLCGVRIYSVPASLSQILDAGRRNIWNSRRRSCGWEILETRRTNG